MSRLIRLNLANNKVKGMNPFTNEESFPNLKWLDVSNNKLTEIPALKCPKLEYLNLSGNKMEKVNEGWTGHANIRILECRDNKYKSLAPFKNMPRLEVLYMADNLMTSLSGWESLPSLKRLHLRKNKIEKMEEEVPELPSLVYLNLRSNNIQSMDMLARLF
jgi:Leucine-rich repeat (LRR) protein